MYEMVGAMVTVAAWLVMPIATKAAVSQIAFAFIIETSSLKSFFVRTGT
jgi:hypothetical protein